MRLRITFMLMVGLVAALITVGVFARTHLLPSLALPTPPFPAQSEPRNYQAQPPPKQPAPPSTMPSGLGQVQTSNTLTYTHPILGYTLAYPGAWNIATNSARPYGFDNFYITSPDYNEFELELTGASIAIAVEKTAYSSIWDLFNKQLLPYISLREVAPLRLNGIGALRYDFSYEWLSATSTDFIEGGRHYSIRYRYASPSSRPVWRDAYEQVVKSFRVGLR